MNFFAASRSRRISLKMLSLESMVPGPKRTQTPIVPATTPEHDTANWPEVLLVAPDLTDTAPKLMALTKPEQLSACAAGAAQIRANAMKTQRQSRKAAVIGR